jgi:hypothetical protein
MKDPHSLSKEKAKDMAKLVREKLSGEDPSEKGKAFVSNWLQCLLCLFVDFHNFMYR